MNRYLTLIAFAGLTTGSTVFAESEIDLTDTPISGQRAVAAVEPLRDELRDNTAPATRRQQIGFFLARIGPEASGAVADLEQIVLNEPANRRWALKALATFGTEASSALPALIEIASDHSQSIDHRLLAAEAMANSVSRRPNVVRWFYETLNDRALSVEEQRGFVSMARVLGPAGGPVTPALIQHLDSADFQTRLLAAESIGLIGSPLAVDSMMLAALNDDDPIVADAAAVSLNQLAAPIETAFSKLLAIGSADLRRRVAMSWKRSSTARSEALRSLLADESEAVQVSAAFALIPTDKDSALAALTRLSEGRSRASREARKILRGLEVGRAQPPACRPE